MDVTPRVQFLPNVKGEYVYLNWHGCLTVRSSTGEILLMDGFSGEMNLSRLGYTMSYPNSLYGLDAGTRVLVQYDILRWNRDAGAKWKPHASLRGHDTPLPRQVYGGLAYAPTTDCVYVFRGSTLFGASAGVSDEHYNPIHLWAYSFEKRKWARYPTDPAKLPPLLKPTELKGGKLLYLEASQKGHPGYLYYFEAIQTIPVWRFDLQSAEWSAPFQTISPIPLSQAPACVDSRRRRALFLKAGEDQTECELYAYTMDSGDWQRIEVKSLKPPSPRVGMGLCYIPDLDRVFLYGGEDFYDSWVYDPDPRVWTRLDGIKSPPRGNAIHAARGLTQRCCQLAWDPVRKLVILQRQAVGAPTWLALRLNLAKSPEWKYR